MPLDRSPKATGNMTSVSASRRFCAHDAAATGGIGPGGGGTRSQRTSSGCAVRSSLSDGVSISRSMGGLHRITDRPGSGGPNDHLSACQERGFKDGKAGPFRVTGQVAVQEGTVPSKRNTHRATTDPSQVYKGITMEVHRTR